MTKHVQFPTSSIQVGQKYGKITVTKIYSVPRNNGSTRSYIEYKCDCGKTGTCQKDNISRGMTHCGCEKAVKVRHGFSQDKSHDNPKWRFYVVYSGMNERCNNPKQMHYHRYGGRGIKCLWKSFEEFRDDMWESYQVHVDEHGLDNTTIDRIDVNGNYCKENCKWATYQEQGFSKEGTRHLEIDGKVYTSKDIADIAGITLMCAVGRMDGYLAGRVSKEEVFSSEYLHPTRNKASYVIVDGKKYSTIDIYTMCGIDRFEAYRRIKSFNKGKITKEQLFYKGKLNLRGK